MEKEVVITSKYIFKCSERLQILGGLFGKGS